MATGFVVTQGMYSDYEPLAVFTQRSSAEKYAALFPAGFRSPQIKEIPIDEVYDFPPGCLRYLVRFDRHGNLSVTQEDPHSGFDDCVQCGDGTGMLMYCWAQNAEHASQITAERRKTILEHNAKNAECAVVP